MPGLKSSNNQRASDQGREASTREAAEVLQMLGTTASGLSEAEAATRLEPNGPNTVAREKQHTWPQPLLVAARTPLVILLTVLAIASFVSYLHDPPAQRDISEFYAGVVMMVMVALGLSLRFIQETRADTAAAK